MVFVRKDPEIEGEPELTYALRLLVLLHELGHAENILKRVNFNHDSLKMDVIEAEAYAHRFVLQYTRRNYLILAMNIYLDHLNACLSGKANEDYILRGVMKAIQSMDLNSLRVTD